MIAMRFTLPLAVGLCALTVSACGGDAKPKSAPGSAENPLTATRPGEVSANPPATGSDDDAQRPGAKVPAGEPSTAAATQAEPGYKALVDRQTAKPRHRFTPCNLVTGREAQDIVGEPMRVPIEAPQGPTCIYRPRAGKALIALAIQDLTFGKIRRQIRHLRQVAVSDRAAYCGTYGQPVLYVPLSGGRVLSVNADCDIARGFAVKAMAHL
jgi:hypothetical protein